MSGSVESVSTAPGTGGRRRSRRRRRRRRRRGREGGAGKVKAKRKGEHNGKGGGRRRERRRKRRRRDVHIVASSEVFSLPTNSVYIYIHYYIVRHSPSTSATTSGSLGGPLPSSFTASICTLKLVKVGLMSRT